MKKWEYKVITRTSLADRVDGDQILPGEFDGNYESVEVNLFKSLNIMGDDGWELCSIEHQFGNDYMAKLDTRYVVYVFKREITNNY